MGSEAKPAFERSVEAAEKLVELLGKPGAERHSRLGRLIRIAFRGGGSAGPDAGDGPDRGEGEAAAGGGGKRGPRGGGRPDWGELDVLADLPRPLRLAPRSSGVAWRAAEEGARPGDPSRFYRDGRGWRTRRPRRTAGGTV